MRRRMQIVFQDPFAALNPRMRVREILAEPFAIHREQGSANRDRLLTMLREVGLDGSALERFPHEFSGGQRQRINIARALALKPEFLVLDEPVSALDVSVGAQVVNLLRELQRTYGLTYLFISHSMPLVRYLCDRVAVMQRGRLVEVLEPFASGTVHTMYAVSSPSRQNAARVKAVIDFLQKASRDRWDPASFSSAG